MNKVYLLVLTLSIAFIIFMVNVYALQWAYNEVIPELRSGEPLSFRDTYALIVLIGSVSYVFSLGMSRGKK